MTRPDPRRHGHPARGFRPIAHCQRYPPHPMEPWPPRGWSELGLLNHQHQARAARLVLWFLALDDHRITDIDARATELQQFGQTAAEAARALADAHEAVVALTNISNVETAEIDMRNNHEETG